MNAEIEEYFYLLREVCRADDSSLGTAYRQLRELLEHLCRTQMTDSSLQMTDLAARINFVSSKLAPLEYILSTATHFILKKYKDHGTIMVPEEKKERMLITP